MSRTMKAPQDLHEEAWEEEYEAGAGPNVLWGRVLALGLFVVLAFFLGRWSTPGGPEESDLQAVRAELREVSAENEALEEELATQALLLEEETAAAATDDETAESEATEGEATEGEATDEAAEEDGVDGNGATDPVGEDEGLSYKVQSGDTLRAIARSFCGDVELADQIAAKNNIKDPTALKAGQLLKLPAECAG